jgi:hypothetical protein
VQRGRAATTLIAAGLAVLACYGVLVWTAIYGNESSTRQVCGAATNPHRDNFLPPYTVCGTGEAAIRATSASASVAGTVLFLLGAGLVLLGVVLLIRDVARRRVPRSTAGVRSRA